MVLRSALSALALVGCSCTTDAVLPDAGGVDAPLADTATEDAPPRDAPLRDAARDAATDAPSNRCSTLEATVGCTAAEFCFENGCGIPGDGFCRPRPTSCDTTGPEVCGCDGTTYANECEANRAGLDVFFRAACDSPDPCRPVNARGEGPCDHRIGYVWDGMQCADLIGCSCVGAECDLVFPDAPACERAYEACGNHHFDCAPGVECVLGGEYCQLETIAGATNGTCLPLPEACSGTATCHACETAFPAGATCTEPELNAVVVTLP